MATYPIEYPPIVPASEYLRIVSSASTNISSYTGRQVVVRNYAAWTLELNFSRMAISKAEVLAAWLDTLQGSYGTFSYVPTTSVTANANTLTLSSVAYPTTQTISVQGFPASGATGLRVGQYVQVGTQLLRIATAPEKADASGNATIEFNPPLRAQYAAGEPFITAAPKGVFRLDASDTDGMGSGFQVDPDWAPEFTTVKAVEVI